MRAEARFASPDEQIVTITLRGTLKQFDDLAGALLAEKAVPFWQAQALIEVIREAAWKLRRQVSAERDTDGSPEGPDRNGLDGEAATAGAAESGIAQESPAHDH